MSTTLSVDVQKCRFAIISGTVGDGDHKKAIRFKRTLLVDGTVRLDQHSCLELLNAGKTVSLPAIASVQIEPSTVVPVGVGRVSYIRESKSNISSLSIYGEVPVEMFDSLWQLMQSNSKASLTIRIVIPTEKRKPSEEKRQGGVLGFYRWGVTETEDETRDGNPPVKDISMIHFYVHTPCEQNNTEPK